MSSPSPSTLAPIRLRGIFRLWLPLAVSFELMMLEGPAVQGAIGRLPDAKLNLAAWGLTMSLSLLVESPIIMLLATSIALVKDWPSYRALRRFTLSAITGCTLVTGLVAFTPLFDLAAGQLMGQPRAFVAAARPAMRIMLLWSAAIGWRRFYQGILVGHEATRLVSAGTTIRLAAAVGTATALALWGRVPGVQVGAIALMAAVVTEAAATTIFALPILHQDVRREREAPPLAQREILRFHLPLAATTLLTLLAQPMTMAALARLPNRDLTLAAGPVVFMVLLVMRGWCFALQEITVAQAPNPAARPTLARFSLLVGLSASAATALLGFTPLLEVYLGSALHAPRDLFPLVRVGIGVGVLLPLVTALGSWARGLLVSAAATRMVYRGMGVNLASHGLLLLAGTVLSLPGMVTAAGAFTLAAVAEYLYLSRQAAALYPCSTEPAAGGAGEALSDPAG